MIAHLESTIIPQQPIRYVSGVLTVMTLATQLSISISHIVFFSEKKKMILLVGVSQLTPKLEQVVNYVDPAAELLTLLSLGVLLPHITPQLPHASP